MFRYITNEESLNNFFAGLISAVVEDGPSVLNSIHDEIQFSNQVEIVGTQRDGYGQYSAANESKRTLDWVIEDDEVLVGYESKRGKSVPNDVQQLHEELGSGESLDRVGFNRQN